MSILGLNNEFDNRNATELMEEIIKCNGKMFIFKHNFDEIINVINQYIKQKFHYGYAYNPIEYFENKAFDESRCEVFRAKIKQKIIDKNILIIDDIVLDDEFIKKYEQEFNKFYIEKDYGRDFDKQNYLQMINISNTVESSLFVCTSNSLYNLYKAAKHDGLLFVSDTSLASLLFVNFNSNCKNVQFNSVLSKSWLIQTPDVQTVNSIFERIKNLEADGVIDNNVLYYFQTNKMALRELYLEALKSEEQLNEQCILKIYNRYFEEQIELKSKEKIEVKDKEVKAYKDRYKKTIEETQKVYNRNMKLENDIINLNESLQISEEEKAHLSNKNIQLESQRMNDNNFITNVKKVFRVFSNCIANVIIFLIIAILIYLYTLYIVKLVLPEFMNNFEKSKLYTIIGVIPLLGIPFIKKVLSFVKIIRNKISESIFNYFINKFQKNYNVK